VKTQLASSVIRYQTTYFRAEKGHFRKVLSCEQWISVQ